MASPDPTPPGPLLEQLPRWLEIAQEGGWVAVALIVLFALIGAGMVIAILWSARYPKPTMLVLTLSIITLGLVGIYTIYGPTRSEVLPLASAALGALVASLTATGRRDAKSAPGKTVERKEPEGPDEPVG